LKLLVEHIAVVVYVGQVSEHNAFFTTLGIDFIDEGFTQYSVAFDLNSCLLLAASVAKCCHLPLLGRTGLGQECF
jgi:hypothetical protein